MNSSGKSLTHCYELIINPDKKYYKNINIIPKFTFGSMNQGSVTIMFVTGINDIMRISKNPLKIPKCRPFLLKGYLNMGARPEVNRSPHNI